MQLMIRIKYMICACLMTFTCLLGGMTEALSSPMVVYEDNQISIEARNQPLVDVLGQIAREAGIVMFVSKDFNAGNCTVSLEKMGLEKALKKLLKAQDVVIIYNKVGREFQISAVRIYPKGKRDGQIEVLVDRAEAAVTPSEEEPALSPVIPGTFEPGQYVRYALKKDPAMVHMAREFERVEQLEYDRISEVSKKLMKADQESEKNRLTLELMTGLSDFESLQRKNVSRMETLYRAALFAKHQSAGN